MRTRLAAFLLLFSTSLCSAQAPALHRLVSIGCDDCGGPAQFAEIADVSITPGGTIYVADRDDPRIRVFSSAGHPVRSFGRRGQGPGEFTGIEKLFPAADGSLAIVDMRLFRLTRTDSTGRYLSSIAIKSFPFDASAAPGSVWFFCSSPDSSPAPASSSELIPLSIHWSAQSARCEISLDRRLRARFTVLPWRRMGQLRWEMGKRNTVSGCTGTGGGPISSARFRESCGRLPKWPTCRPNSWATSSGPGPKEARRRRSCPGRSHTSTGLGYATIPGDDFGSRLGGEMNRERCSMCFPPPDRISVKL